jgi:hypothetical protein
MPATSTLVSETQAWDSSLGLMVTTKVLESFGEYPAVESGAYEVSKTQSEGKYTTQFKLKGTAVANHNLEISSSCSTEPLITHKIFQQNGSKALSDDDKAAILKAESEPTLFKTYLAQNATNALGWYSYFIVNGVDSFLLPSVTLTYSKHETLIIDLSVVGKGFTTIPSISAPNLPTGATWLCVGASSKSISDGLWLNSYEYKSSGGRGWSASLYDYAGGGLQ